MVAFDFPRITRPAQPRQLARTSDSDTPSSTSRSGWSRSTPPKSSTTPACHQPPRPSWTAAASGSRTAPTTPCPRAFASTWSAGSPPMRPNATSPPASAPPPASRRCRTGGSPSRRQPPTGRGHPYGGVHRPLRAAAGLPGALVRWPTRRFAAAQGGARAAHLRPRHGRRRLGGFVPDLPVAAAQRRPQPAAGGGVGGLGCEAWRLGGVRRGPAARLRVSGSHQARYQEAWGPSRDHRRRLPAALCRPARPAAGRQVRLSPDPAEPAVVDLGGRPRPSETRPRPLGPVAPRERVLLPARPAAARSVNPSRRRAPC
jgi:hypothetical protein